MAPYPISGKRIIGVDNGRLGDTWNLRSDNDLERLSEQEIQTLYASLLRKLADVEDRYEYNLLYKGTNRTFLNKKKKEEEFG